MKVGILGAGQLAQLLAHSAYQLGIETLCFSETQDAPAARLSPLYLEDLEDQQALIDFAKLCDVITLENENINVEILKFLQQYTPVFPGTLAIEVAQDRLFEKTLFSKLSIPTPLFAEVSSAEDLQNAVQKIGTPAILKTRRFGYDGKGQIVIKAPDQVATAWEQIGKVPAILEGFVPFDFEVSLIAARNAKDEMIFYPLSKNTHCEGIMRVAESPYLNPHLQQLAEEYMTKLFKTFDYVGVLAFEFFVKGDQLIANEIAPRVHNSGHATIEGFNVSQFESHLRAILNLSLLKPVLRTPTVMLNVIGSFPRIDEQTYQEAHVYDYGKAPREGRKLGHITLSKPSEKIANQLKRILES